MTVPQQEATSTAMIGESVPSKNFVILSDRRESKDLRTDHPHSTLEVRRSFDALRLLRMTDFYIDTNLPNLVLVKGFDCGTAVAVLQWIIEAFQKS